MAILTTSPKITVTEVFNQRGSQNPFRMVSYEEHRVIHLTLLPINFQSNPSPEFKLQT